MRTSELIAHLTASILLYGDREVWMPSGAINTKLRQYAPLGGIMVQRPIPDPEFELGTVHFITESVVDEAREFPDWKVIAP